MFIPNVVVLRRKGIVNESKKITHAGRVLWKISLKSFQELAFVRAGSLAKLPGAKAKQRR